jgi:alpha-beta hydrolase superfamily lysophospholipase
LPAAVSSDRRGQFQARSASVFGHSSGATLALKAAGSDLPITHLVLYEPPFNPPFLRNAVQATAKTLPNGRLAVLPGQSHDLNPDATAPVMTEFFA